MKCRKQSTGKTQKSIEKRAWKAEDVFLSEKKTWVKMAGFERVGTSREIKDTNRRFYPYNQLLQEH